jgi:hypothetical protein
MKNVKFNLFKFSIFLLFLQSMFAWITWGLLIPIIILTVSSSIIYFSSEKKIFVFNKSDVIPILLIAILEFYIVRDGTVWGYIAAILRIVILSVMLFLKDPYKIKLLHFFTKYLAIILSISLFAWVLYLIGISLPYSVVEFNNGQYCFNNYSFFLVSTTDFSIIPRFQSIFLEPGQMGMITTFLLFVNGFELKRKSVLIIFIATLLSFSLAAYLLLVISFTVYIIFYSKKPIVSIILFGVVLILMFFYFYNLNNGDNLVNNLIFERLKFVDGNIAGNNRFSYDFDFYFQRFIDSNDVFWGIGDKLSQLSFERGSAGYKVFLVQNGFFGTLMVFLLYLFIVLNKRSKMAWTLLLVYVLCFLQAAYPLWECELFIFITAMPFLKDLKKKIQNK